MLTPLILSFEGKTSIAPRCFGRLTEFVTYLVTSYVTTFSPLVDKYLAYSYNPCAFEAKTYYSTEFLETFLSGEINTHTILKKSERAEFSSSSRSSSRPSAKGEYFYTTEKKKILLWKREIATLERTGGVICRSRK